MSYISSLAVFYISSFYTFTCKFYPFLCFKCKQIYSFNYQQTILFEDPIVILPGDEFILDCWTNSSTRREYTDGGESSSQEMCFAFIFYYPKIALEESAVSKSFAAIHQFFQDAQSAGYLGGNTGDLYDMYNAWNFSLLNTWNSSKDGSLEFYNRLWSVDYPQYNDHEHECSDGNGTTIYSSDSIARDESFVHYELQDISCDNTDDDDEETIGVCIPTLPTTTDDEIEGPSVGNIINTFVSISCVVIAFIFS